MTDTFWAFIGLILFLALLFYFKVPAMALRSLDERAKRIAGELDEALRLREEAQGILAEYQQKCAGIEQDVQEIITAAKHEAEIIVAEARVKTEEYVKNRNKLVEQKIAQAESDAIQEISSSAVNLAISSASKIINNELGAKKANNLIKESIIKVKTNLH
ncbi:ATP synthase subunit B [Bartonella bacilliformis str. Heidi Mejia]|uniref:F0F1 ATP synthase subunit B n=1 Tax=Bartonella bacilliformis TaxID=774 RepID=UPI000451158A|nr:F0F1 ATP synthase subunit B [Bartonella bacilliformis]EYS92331.1 ATP synthase subunit B [Bartonella bacilliformis str. Heidi Mejia]EYS94929.1 ATP synthase subunit B [Bartonella bacilliformis Peru-18]KEG17602.1 ATP synthase subunit B [Bartonella bacilliformis CUSCO5]KEG18598.1 ATP synthase subunit B [Bartonella bacilliformis Hosp800-02]KEG24055.1 ATP synthase subunit B [Bartonella bacilliformis CAR600-02]